MNKASGLTEKQASFLLAAVIIARATAYIFSKVCLETMGPFTLLGMRSLLACIFMLPFAFNKLRRIKKREIINGSVLGVLFFLTMVFELMGLKSTNVSIASILENTAIVMVPLIVAVISRKPPNLKALLCCMAALLGIIFMSMEGSRFSLSSGEWTMLLAAFFYALSIIYTSKYANGSEPVAIGFLLVAVMGILSGTAAFIFESPAIPVSSETWGSLIYLAVVCTGFGFTLQPLAQSKCSAEKAAVFCALNPLVATVLGVLLMGEAMAGGDILGLLLVLLSIVIYGKGSK